MTHLKRNLMSLSFEVMLALLGLGVSSWFLTEKSINYQSSDCMKKLDSNTGTAEEIKTCKKDAVYISILTIMVFVSIIMLVWGVSCY